MNEYGQLTLWGKQFGSKVDSPCRVNSLYFEEAGQISSAATHSTLGLIATVSSFDRGEKQIIALSYESKKKMLHAGFFLPKDPHRFVVKDICWIEKLPLLLMLTADGRLKIVGPEISPISEDINSFSSMLTYAMNTMTPYYWKIYFNEDFNELKPSNILHLNTLFDEEQNSYTEIILVIISYNYFLRI